MNDNAAENSTKPSRRQILAGAAVTAWTAPAVVGRVVASAATSDAPPPPPGCTPTLLLLASPGAEDGITPGWTVLIGSPEAITHATGAPGAPPVPAPPGGGTFFFGETNSTAFLPPADAHFSGLFQIVELPLGFLPTVDAGGATIDLSAWFLVNEESGAGLVYARPFATSGDAASTPVPFGSVDDAVGLSPNEFGPAFQGPIRVWQPKARTIDVPPGSRFLRVDVGLADRSSEMPTGAIRAGVDVIEITACI